MADMKHFIALLLLSLRLPLAGLEVDFFPQIVLLDRTETFVLSSEEMAPISMRLNGLQLGEETPVAGKVEFNHAFNHGGELTFTQGSTNLAFRVVQPEEEDKLVQKDGFLYAGPLPAILFSRHTARYTGRIGWEVLGVVGSLFAWQKEPSEGISLLMSHKLPHSTPKEWRKLAPADGLYEVFGAIETLSQQEPSQELLLALSTQDLERGMRTELFRQSVEWFLQSAASKGYERLGVVSLPMSESLHERFPYITRDLRWGAVSCRAAFLSVPYGTKDWTASLTQALNKGGAQ